MHEAPSIFRSAGLFSFIDILTRCDSNPSSSELDPDGGDHCHPAGNEEPREPAPVQMNTVEACVHLCSKASYALFETLELRGDLPRDVVCSGVLCRLSFYLTF